MAEEDFAIRSRGEIRREGCSLASWLDARPLLTASAVPRKQSPGSEAGATRRTPTTVTSYTTEFISLCYVRRRDVGCRKPSSSPCSRRRPHPHRPPSRLSLALTLDPLRRGTVLQPVQPVTSWAARMAASESRKPFGKRQTLSGSIVTRSRARKFNVYKEIDFSKKVSILENISSYI